MLKLLILVSGVILSVPVLSCKPYGGRISYMPETIPSCVILDEEKYWEWRDKVPDSSHIQGDINTLYKRFYVRYSGLAFGPNGQDERNSTKYKSAFAEAMCSEDILYSVELAKIMNSFGSNVSPRSFLVTMSMELDKSKFERGSYDIDLDLFSSTVQSVLAELESRFE